VNNFGGNSAEDGGKEKEGEGMKRNGSYADD